MVSVSLKLRTERTDKDGLSVIYVSLSWRGRRCRVSTEERASPNEWDSRRGLLRDYEGNDPVAARRVMRWCGLGGRFRRGISRSDS